MKKLLTILIFFVFIKAWSQEPADPHLTTELLKVRVQSEASSEGPYASYLLTDVPVSANQYDSEKRERYRIGRLADLSKMDASVSDAYSAVGYWDNLSIRGFILDGKFSYFREGLPISGETSLPLDNKAQIQLLKGLSAVQNGTASPGGSVLYIVKRPSHDKFEKIVSSWSQENQLLVSIEKSQKLDEDSPFSYHVQAAYENLAPPIENAQGTRHFFSTAWDYRLSEKTLWQIELEWSKRSQASQAGLSLFGNRLPEMNDPAKNLNRQPWTLPVVMEGLTGSLGIKQTLNEQQDWSATFGLQELKTDDRLSYPFGCTAENQFDRFCSDGSFDVYDFRSEGEKRYSSAGRLQFNQKYDLGLVRQQTTFGFLASRSDENFNRQAYNYVGVDSVYHPVHLPADSNRTDEATLRNSQLLEFSLLNVSTLNSWEVWWGLRKSEVLRHTIRTDASRETNFREDFLLGNLALVRKFENARVYVSFAEGLEAAVTPNRAEYTDAGRFLPGYRSQQYEIGIKGSLHADLHLSAALFQIDKPLLLDQPPVYMLEGRVRHQGLELQIDQRLSRWQYGIAGMLLKAEQNDSVSAPHRNGLRPVNIPQETLRSFMEYQIIKQWQIYANHSYEGSRAVTGDNSILLPGWQRWDLGSRYHLDKKTYLQFNIENLLDTKYWKESPTQYGHIYLYPGMERTYSVLLAHEL